YGKPGRTQFLGEDSPYVDPFEIYGLDSDFVPTKIEPNDYYAKREVPPQVVSPLIASDLDRRNLRDTNVAALLGRQAANVPSLPARIFELAIWISRVADQPTAIWWAAGQSGLHPDLKSLVRDTLRRQGGTDTPRIRTAWQYLFESW